MNIFNQILNIILNRINDNRKIKQIIKKIEH